MDTPLFKKKLALDYIVNLILQALDPKNESLRELSSVQERIIPTIITFEELIGEQLASFCRAYGIKYDPQSFEGTVFADRTKKPKISQQENLEARKVMQLLKTQLRYLSRAANNLQKKDPVTFDQLERTLYELDSSQRRRSFLTALESWLSGYSQKRDMSLKAELEKEKKLIEHGLKTESLRTLLAGGRVTTIESTSPKDEEKLQKLTASDRKLLALDEFREVWEERRKSEDIGDFTYEKFESMPQRLEPLYDLYNQQLRAVCSYFGEKNLQVGAHSFSARLGLKGISGRQREISMQVLIQALEAQPDLLNLISKALQRIKEIASDAQLSQEIRLEQVKKLMRKTELVCSYEPMQRAQKIRMFFRKAISSRYPFKRLNESIAFEAEHMHELPEDLAKALRL